MVFIRYSIMSTFADRRVLAAPALSLAVALVGEIVWFKLGSEALLLLDACSFAECFEGTLLE